MPKPPSNTCPYREMAAQIRAIATSAMDPNTVALALKIARDCVQLGAKKDQSPTTSAKAARGAGVVVKARPLRQAKRTPRTAKTRVLRVKSKGA